MSIYVYLDDVIKYGIGNPENPYGKNENTKFSKSVRNILLTCRCDYTYFSLRSIDYVFSE